MICIECGGENRKNARFCSWCGVRVALRCAVCSTDLVPGAEFCDACGTPVGEPADTPAPLGARKVVTILFADLAGSTSQHEQMDPESVRRFMDEYYATVRDAVEEEGGRVVKLMGDGVMAAFGVPRVAEDDAKRAVRAGAAMQAGFLRLADRAAQQFGTPVGLRVGINTGEVVVAAGDNDVVGDAVNVAARLQTSADNGEVIVGESTWRLVRDTLTLEALPPLTVKGKAEPVRAYRLLSLEAPITAPVGATLFVGRDTELARLVGFYDDTVAVGETRVISVIGSPGVGKSRLARELVSALQSRASVLEAGCPPAGSTTFGPIADLIRQAAGIGDDATRQAASDAVLQLLPDDEPDRDRIAERVVALLGAGAPATPEEVFWAVRRVLAGIASDRPLVVVLDDIHWAEPMLLDLIEHLAEWGRDAAILVVALARPELRDLRPALTEGGRRVAGVVVLEGLGGEASQRLARDLLGAGDLPAAVAGKLLAVTEGNPLFLRELVRMLVDDGVLVRDGDEWITSIDAADLDVPPTVHALLSARIERLDSDERIILERAAVIGPQFPRGGVIAIAPSTIGDDFDRHLETLRRRELVEPEGTYWGDEPLYRFHHVLIRDAAYRGLLREARADLHERYADWLEAKVEDGAEQAEVLGFHLERAHEERQQLSGEPHADLGARAARWLATAGRRALERDDVGAAAGLLGRALDRIPEDDPERSSLLIDRAEAVLAAGDVTTGGACITVLRALSTGEPRLEAWADCFAGELANLTDPSRLHTTVGEVADAAERLTAMNDFAGAAKAHGVRAGALARLGRIAECEAALDKALAAARQAGDLRRANSVLAGAPLAALWGPSPVARASGKCLDVVRVLRITSGSPAVEATALRCQAVLEALRGRDDAARRMLAAARTSLEELGLRSGLLETDLFAGIIDLLAGDPIGAEADLRAAYEGFRELGVDTDAAQSAALLARALLGQGRDDEALALTEESERRGGEDLKTAIAWRSARAQALARRGDVAEAIALARHAVTLAQPTDLVIDHADACTALAKVLRTAGRDAEAAVETRQAAELYERKGATAAIDHEPVAAPTASAGPISAAPILIPENSASRTVQAVNELYAQGDLAGGSEYVAENVRREDRRSGLGAVTVGREAWIEERRFVHSVPVRFVRKVLATRGDRLVLDHSAWEGEHPTAGPFDGDALVVNEVDTDSRLVATVLFDSDDAGGAYDELDRRFLEHEGAADAKPAALALEIMRQYNARDFDAMRGLLADDFVVADHRFAGWGTVGIDEYVNVLQGLIDLAPDSQLLADTLEVAPGAVTYLGHAAGTALTGGHVELPYVGRLVVDADGKAKRLELYPAEQLGDVSHPAPTPDTLRNAATAAADRGRDLGRQGDWEALARVYAEDVRFEDRRAGLGTVAVGREASVDEARFVYAQVDVENVPIATRGEHIALAHTRWTGLADGEALSLTELNEEGEVTARLRFDIDDRDGAFDELDRRYEAIEPGFAIGHRFVRALNARDWVELAATLTEDFVFVDSFPATAEALDRDGYIEYLRATVELAPELRMRMHAVPVVGPNGGIVRTAFEGPGLAGGTTDTSGYTLGFVHDGRFSRMEVFDLDQLDVALRRLDELRSSHVAVENRASRASANLDAAVLTRDFETAAGLLAPDAVLADRRAGLRTRSVGRDAVVRELRVIVSSVRERRSEVYAVRGEMLLLRKCLGVGEDQFGNPFEVPFVQVMRLDENDQIAETTTFDADDMDGATDYLDALYLAGEGRHCAFFLRTAFDFVRIFNNRDWDAVTAAVAEDFVHIDHSPIGSGTTNRADWVQMQVRMVELSPDTRFDTARLYRVEPWGGVLGYYRRVGTRMGGGVSDSSNLLVTIWRDGLLVRAERFTPDQLNEAFERFDELRPAPGRPLAADVVTEDRRRGLSGTVRGRDAVERHMDEWRALGLDVAEEELVATRGPRLNLYRRTRRRTSDDTAGDAEVSYLGIVELNDAGEAAAIVILDVDRLDDAHAELDARLKTNLTEECALAFDLARAVPAAFNRRENAQIAELAAPGFELIDHTPNGFGALGQQGWVEIAQTLANLAPDTVMRLADIDVAANATLSVLELSGSGLAGGPTEMTVVLVGTVAAGRYSRIDRYSAEQLDAARARFADLTAPPPSRPVAVENAVTRLYAGLDGERWVERHLDQFVAIHDPDVVVEARSTAGERYRTEGRDLSMAEAGSLYEVGLTRLTAEALAVRGERLALMRFVNTRQESEHGGPADVEQICVTETNEAGLLSRIVIFEPQDLTEAFRELDERFAVGEGSEHGALVRYMRDAIVQLNSRDWESWAASYAPDFEYVDHGPVGWGRRDRAEFIRIQRDYVEMAPDNKWAIIRYHRLAGEAAAFTLRSSSSGLAGGETEITRECVALLDGPLCTRLETFAGGDVEAAIARFEALTASGDRQLVNDAVRARRAEPPRFADDVVLDDRRQGLRFTGEGKRGLVANMRALPLPITGVETIAIRGERLALNRVTRAGDAPHGGGEAEVEFLVLHELNDDGEIGTAIMFGLDDLVAAHAELDRRWLHELGGATPEEPIVVGAARAVVRAVNDNDVSLLEATFAPDLVVLDANLHLSYTREMYMADLLRSARTPGIRAWCDAEAVLGQRHAVVTWHVEFPAGASRGPWSDMGGGQTIRYVAVRCDAAGRATHIARTGDLLTALIRAEELYAADEAGGEAAAASARRLALLRGLDAYNHRDFGVYASIFTDDVEFVDHRPLSSAPLRGRDQVVQWYRAVFDMVPDGQVHPVGVHLYDRFDAVLTMRGRGHNDDGGEVVLEFVAWVRMNDHGITRMEYFPPDALDEALAAARSG
jgi:class 3 adenylate cyclase/ketosteroid isomerase-like protein